MTPNEVVETLNDYFNQMIEIIFKYNGILDKIIGDELMVIYGVPKSNIQDSQNAVLTAIEMQEKLIAFNQDRCINLKKPIKVGIGVNTGSVISGNIGSNRSNGLYSDWRFSKTLPLDYVLSQKLGKSLFLMQFGIK